MTKISQDQIVYAFRSLVAIYLQDHATLLESARTAASLPSYSQNADRARYGIAWAHLGLHDLGAARTALATADRASPMPALTGFMGAALAAEVGDPAPVMALARQVQAGGPDAISAADRASIARLLADVGDVAGAEAMAVGGRDDCYPCAVARARIAVLKGDRSAAIRLFRHATDLGPSLPEAWHEWGRARLAWGNVEGARLAFQQAHRLGPRWADPLKYEGDALLAAGDARGAERRYREAAERRAEMGRAAYRLGSGAGGAGSTRGRAGEISGGGRDGPDAGRAGRGATQDRRGGTMSDQTEGRRPRKRREAAPTTPDAVEIAMDRIIAGEPEDGPAHAVLRGHRDLLRWQTISERMSVALKVLTGLTGR